MAESLSAQIALQSFNQALSVEEVLVQVRLDFFVLFIDFFMFWYQFEYFLLITVS